MIIWLASYPRSGNTYFRVILNSIFGIKTYSIYDDKVDIGADKKTIEIVGHEFLPANFDIETARKEEKTYYIKTHGEPLNDEDKVVYLIRDGRESTLSNMLYQNSFYNKSFTLWDAILGNIDMGTWGDHVKKWDPNRRKNTLLVKFEELIDAPLENINDISDFLNIKAVGDSVPSFNELQKLNPFFFRSGKKSSWKKVYTRDEHLMFWIKNATQMKEYGYLDDIPEQSSKNTNIEYFRLFSLENEYRINKLEKNIQRKLNVFNRQEIIRKKSNELRHKQKVIARQSAGLDELREKLKESEEKNHEKTAALSTNEDIIARQDAGLEKLREKLKESEQKNHEKTEALGTKEGVIARQSAGLKELREKLKESEDKNHVKAAQLSINEDVIAKQSKGLDQLQGVLKERDRAIREKQTELNKKQDVIDEPIFHVNTSSVQTDILISKLNNLSKERFFRNPIKKFRTYKAVLTEFHKLNIFKQKDKSYSNLTKNSSLTIPSFSVITVTFNAGIFLENTINSVVNQKNCNLEYIIIDGSSTDNTLEIIKHNEDNINFWLSESDNGLYDAMNKGIERATGEYIIFMNAGDIFTDANVLEKVLNTIDSKVDDVVYGDRFYVRENGEKYLQKANSIETVFERMPFGHQASLIKSEILKNTPFNTTYKYGADYDLIIKLYIEGKNFKYVKFSICDYLSGGKSESGIRPYLEALKIVFDSCSDKNIIKKNQYYKSFKNNCQSLLDI